MIHRSVCLLGSTGSIGRQAEAVLRAHPQNFTVLGLAAAGGRVDDLVRQVALWHPPTVVVADPAALPRLEAGLASAGLTVPNLAAGPQAVSELAGQGADLVLNGITG
ncbi:MAG: 1-deoxy-D-xylulose-5-phosphate reductoisomerase, partial [Bifidobacteriaceae bacterium]|nr:1-deoxy-D-xylulose-5-phosphate reductoisomerase [Bifidobacteriaceae bacterium]